MAKGKSSSRKKSIEIDEITMDSEGNVTEAVMDIEEPEVIKEDSLAYQSTMIIDDFGNLVLSPDISCAETIVSITNALSNQAYQAASNQQNSACLNQSVTIEAVNLLLSGSPEVEKVKRATRPSQKKRNALLLVKELYQPQPTYGRKSDE